MKLSLVVPDNIEIPNPAELPEGGMEKLEIILQRGIEYFFLVAAVTFLFLFLWGGIQWITSGGEAKAIEKARGRIIFALVGFLIILLSYVIMDLIWRIIFGQPSV